MLIAESRKLKAKFVHSEQLITFALLRVSEKNRVYLRSFLNRQVDRVDFQSCK